MRSPLGLLRNRMACVLGLIFCTVEAVWSWASVRSGLHREGLFDIAFLGFVIFLTASISFRSPLWVDRVVFGAISVAFALGLAKFAFFAPGVNFAINSGHALMWTIAAAGCLMALRGQLGANKSDRQ